MNRRGFTLIETLIAIVMLSVVVLSLGRFMASFQNATTKATMLTEMTSVAKERLELIRADPRYTSLVSKYAEADTSGFAGYPMIHRKTVVARDQSGSPARDLTTVTVKVFTTPAIVKDTVSVTAVLARP
jgi:prepilin-type N-terminal cleavage/methylation domain-containing protein